MRGDHPSQLAEGLPSSGHRVTFFYDPKRTFNMDQQLREFLHEPPALPENVELPYHLDSRHARVLADVQKGSMVLEVGCGGGQMRRWVKKLDLEYFGTDVRLIPLDEELRVYGGPDLTSDAHFLPIRDCSVDVVYSAAVTEHFACPILAFQNVFRTLKHGGYFLGNCSFLETWHANSYFHMTPLGVVELLCSTGFEIEHCWPEKGYTVFNAAMRTAFRGPFRVFLPIVALLSRLYKLQSGMRAFRHRIRGTKTEHPLMDEARVAGAIFFIARKPTL